MSVDRLLESVSKKADDIFVVSFSPELEVIFRLPSHRQAYQYAEILTMLEDGDPIKVLTYDFIFSTYVEDNWLVNHEENLPAGVPETITKVILYLSGVDEEHVEYTLNMLDQQRVTVERDMLSHMKRTICIAFQGYTFETIEKMNYQKIVYIFAQAEQSLIERGIIEDRYTYQTQEDESDKQHSPKINFDELMRDNKALQQYESGGVSPGQREEHNLHNIRQRQ